MVSEEELTTRKNYALLCLDVNPVLIVSSYGLLGLRFGEWAAGFRYLRIYA